MRSEDPHTARPSRLAVTGSNTAPSAFGSLQAARGECSRCAVLCAVDCRDTSGGGADSRVQRSTDGRARERASKKRSGEERGRKGESGPDKSPYFAVYNEFVSCERKPRGAVRRHSERGGSGRGRGASHHGAFDLYPARKEDQERRGSRALPQRSNARSVHPVPRAAEHSNPLQKAVGTVPQVGGALGVWRSCVDEATQAVFLCVCVCVVGRCT